MLVCVACLECLLRPFSLRMPASRKIGENLPENVGHDGLAMAAEFQHGKPDEPQHLEHSL